MVVMRSGEATPDDALAFDRWLQGNARHRQAWQQLAGPVDRLLGSARSASQCNPSQAAAIGTALHDSARKSVQRRQILRGALAFGGVAAVAAVLADRRWPMRDLVADMRTGTGERRDFALADGSRLLLNARSACDVQDIPKQRGLRLRSGEAIAQVLPDARPFMLYGSHGHARTTAGTATRMLMRHGVQRSLAAAVEGPLQLTAVNGLQRLLEPGKAAWFGPEGIEPIAAPAASVASWQGGRLEVHDRPLGEVIAALQAYRRGLVRISPAAAALRVYGSYPLDDTDRALAAIGQTLPVAVHLHSGGWLVRIDLA
ncbi:hypothetical protein ASE76_19535 [Xylophilus sp. Leaf220]|nr:hypothetical protein ASE76_19535 [Xylophilus sp. Leaf220]